MEPTVYVSQETGTTHLWLKWCAVQSKGQAEERTLGVPFRILAVFPRIPLAQYVQTAAQSWTSKPLCASLSDSIEQLYVTCVARIVP